MITAMSFNPKIKDIFECYDAKFGCLAIRKDERWWIAVPDGSGIRCKSEQESRDGAQFLNLTVTDEEWEEWTR